MIKRVTWFVGGAVAGIVGTGVAKRKVKAAAAELTPANVVRRTKERVREAVAEGRLAKRAREDELRARLDGRSGTLADELDNGDEVIVDGSPVEPGRVIVLRQVRDGVPPGRRRRA